MTTTVTVGLQKPNHLNARVRAHVRNSDGTIGDALNEIVLGHGETTENYVHSGQVLVIEECDLPAPVPAVVEAEELPTPGSDESAPAPVETAE